MKYLHIVVLSSLLFMSSCVKQEPEFAVSEASYSLKLNIAGADTHSRSASDVETTLNETIILLFDASGQLERRVQRDIFPNNIDLDDITRGDKKLCVLTNYKAHAGLNSITLDTLTSYSTFRELQLHYKAEAAPLASIPMDYVSALTIPLGDPNLTVGLNRMLARITVNDDITKEGFVTDSVCFTKLTRSLYPWADDLRINTDTTQVLRFTTGVRSGIIYMMPALGNQISYVAYGKNDQGVTKVYKGVIVPAIGANRSYTLSLLKGKLENDGNVENLEVTVDPAVGTYSEQDSVLHLKHRTGAFSIEADSYDAVGITTASDWLTATPSTRASKDKYSYSLSFQDYRPEVVGADDIRKDTIILYNKLDPTRRCRIFVEQEQAKYYVVAVSGQSNASGYDSSPYNPAYDAPNPRVFQFGQRGVIPPVSKKFTAASTLDIIPLLHEAHTLDGNRISPIGKGVHLPLGKALLPHIPEGYDVLVVSCSFSGIGFIAPSKKLGNYDPVKMRNTEFPRALEMRIGIREGVIYNVLVDRIVRALKLNSKNKFVGVVWSQGEADSNPDNTDSPAACYTLFKDFTRSFFEDINNQVDHNQLPESKPIGSHTWFSIDCAPNPRRNWYAGNNTYAGGHVFGRYKVWNPDSYVPLPLDIKQTDVNHFGDDAWAETIAPLILGRMLHNGVVGDKKSNVPYFVRQITQSEAQAQSGSIQDADIQNEMDVYLPFDQVDMVTKNLALNNPATVTNNGLSIGDAQELKDINGNLRQRKVLNLNGPTGNTLQLDFPAPLNSWTVSFMLRRTNGLNDISDKYLLRVPGTTAQGVFIHKYRVEDDGGYLGLAFQPWKKTFDRLNSIVFRLIDASYVRTHEEWIHYAFSYNHLTRTCSLYVNGEKISPMEKVLNGASASNILSLVLGDAEKGLSGQLFDLCIWHREVPAETLFKTYIMSYYGITK